MKAEKLLSLLTGAAFAFCIAYGGVGGMVSGFAMEGVTLSEIALFTAAVSLFAAACYTWRWGGWLMTGVLALGLGFFLRGGEVLDSVEGVLHDISRYYDRAYGWGVIQWGQGNPQWAELTPGLCALTVPVILPVAWTVCRRKNGIFAIVPGIAPLAACLVVTDTVPDSGSLMLLMTALLLFLLTQMGRRRSAAAGLRQTALLLIPAVLCTQILFWAVPRENYQPSENRVGFWEGWFSGGDSTDDGKKEETPKPVYPPGAVVLNEVGPRSYRNAKMMQVIAESTGVLYLRGQAYDSYDGLSWDSAKLDSTVDSGWPVQGLKNRGKVRIHTKDTEGIYYFPYYPGEKNWFRLLEKGALVNADGEREYAYEWMVISPGSESDSGARLDVQIREQCLQIPAGTAMKAEALLKQLDLEDLTQSQKAEKIGRYVSGSAEYSLNTGYMPKNETDFAIWFLEDSETGYCVHFATAATVLLRSAGIPARYVTGYTLTAIADRQRDVLDSHAHAWVEYFDAEIGWKVLDPTPSRQSQIDPLPTEPEETTQPTQPDETDPTKPSDTESKPSENTQPGATAQTNPQAPEENRRGGGDGLRYFGAVFAILAGVGVIYGQYRLRRRMRQQKMYRGDPNRQAIARWLELRRYARLLRKKIPEELTDLAEKARFSQYTLTQEELARFTPELDKSAEALAEKNAAVALMCRLIWAVK